MRQSFSLLLAAVMGAQMLAAPAMATASSCMKPAEREAFELAGLKSELTNLALACKQQDRFNTFMTTYKPAMVSDYTALNAYFRRVYGKQGQAKYDEYITNLSGEQEIEALKSGTAFCMVVPQMFDEVMALHDSTELAGYARSQALVQPISLDECAAPPVKTKAKARARSKKKA